jgi:hypothetical protein
VSLLRKSQLKPHLQPNDLDDNDNLIIDDEVTFGRNLRSYTFGKLLHQDEVSDYVKFRLFIARLRAMQRYKEIWT